jgi:hypothetical protein
MKEKKKLSNHFNDISLLILTSPRAPPFYLYNFVCSAVCIIEMKAVPPMTHPQSACFQEEKKRKSLFSEFHERNVFRAAGLCTTCRQTANFRREPSSKRSRLTNDVQHQI